MCRALGSTARVPRAKAKDGIKYEARETHRYSPEELEHIAHAIETEELRGATPRDWEDVTVGSSVQPMLKGPLNITDMICWYSGGGHSYQAHRRATMYRKRHPADAFIDPKTGAQDSPARGHAEQKMARIWWIWRSGSTISLARLGPRAMRLWSCLQAALPTPPRLSGIFANHLQGAPTKGFEAWSARSRSHQGFRGYLPF